MKKYTRREFIKIGSMGTGALVVGGGLPTKWFGLDRDPVLNPGTDGSTIVPTFCEICFWKCGILAHVKDGVVTKLEGNPKHPLSNGRLCPRGVGGLGTLYDKDRLKKPMIRSKKRGEEVFTEVDWDTALGKVAEGMSKIRDQYGPEAMALFNHGTGGSWFSQLMKVYGSENITAPSFAQCRGPREVGWGLTFGKALGSPERLDIENARCLTLIGSHLGENMHNTQIQELADGIGRGMQLVVVDPRYSIAAGKAKYWLPIKPGTDIALLLAWMNVIISEKRYDADYLEKYANGFEELKAHVASKTPEWAAPLTGISADQIRETARFISGFKPASMIHPGRHATWYGDDTQRARAMAILDALLGNYGRRGGILKLSKMKVPAYPLAEGALTPAKPPKPTADRTDPKQYPFAEEVIANEIIRSSIPGKGPYPIKGWLVYGTNLIQAMPNPKETIEAIQQLELLVSIDTMPAEICGWSDILLPECTYLEREDDLVATAWKKPYISLRQKVVPPLYDSKEGWWIAQQLAKRLGHGAAFDWPDVNTYLKKRVELGGYSWDELKKTGVVLGEVKPTCEEEGLIPQFETESGKIELYCKNIKAAGFDPLPEFTAHAEPPKGTFRMLMGRSPVHTFGRTTNTPILLESYPENEVWVNTDAAKEIQLFGRPLKTGDRVVLVNQDGVKSAPIKARVTERIRPDCVYLVHGFGHTSKGLSRGQRGASDSQLVSQYKVDPLMGGTGMNVNFVRFEKVEAV